MTSRPCSAPWNGAVLRIVALSLPAFYCSWIALCVSRRLELFSPAYDGVRSVVELESLVAAHRRHNASSILVEEGQSDEYACFPLNSERWLKSTRHGNYDEGGAIRYNAWMTSPPTISFGTLQSALGQTLCYEQSPLLNTTMTALDEAYEVRLWTTRLIYWAVYDHQHRPAYAEMKLRMRSPPRCLNDKAAGVGSFDFECPDAKFLVVSYYKNGIGANMRLGAVPALEAGLASGRVVLFVDDADVDGLPGFLREPWPLVSCSKHLKGHERHTRRDAQCFFRPESPCVVTSDELATAYALQRGEARQLFRYGRVPESRVEDRVLIVHLSYRPQRQPDNLAAVLYEKALKLIEGLVASSVDYSVNPELLHKAAVAILEGDEGVITKRNELPPEYKTTAYQYYGAASPIFHSLLLYAMRPNQRATSDIDAILLLPHDGDLSTEATLGLPIRASDKCGIESECLSFSQYVSAARETWAKYRGSINASVVVLTTESKSVLAEQANYSSNSIEGTFPTRFVTNQFDILQDTGYFDTAGKGADLFSADDAMLSAISSLKLQLQTDVTVGNCCSNFHLLLKDLLYAGCGANPTNVFECLQDHDRSEFRLCCSWDKTPECRARMKVLNTA